MTWQSGIADGEVCSFSADRTIARTKPVDMPLFPHVSLVVERVTSQHAFWQCPYLCIQTSEVSEDFGSFSVALRQIRTLHAFW